MYAIPLLPYCNDSATTFKCANKMDENEESVSAAAGAVDDHIDICPHNNIDIDFILL